MAQKELYDTFKSRMFGICLRYAGNYDDAQDILQDGFLKVFEKIDQFEFRGAFEGWIRKIMVNKALERFRTNYQVININDNLKEVDNEYTGDFSSDIDARELIRFVQELSPRYRTVFNLYAIEGYSHKEIGEMLGITEGTSKSNLSRARDILQEKVNRFYLKSVKSI
ncbi:MAG: RNA polymerase sigma factor [Bacteroidales bacterium]|nr:RNA polymerase sigma factor [Bacteroidales bacterium]MBN2762760.1 RNA polymerase sigma factor [Bacteroidales bacterium]